MEAALLIRRAREDRAFRPVQSEVNAAGRDLLAVLHMPGLVMNSFTNDLNREIAIQLQRGTETAIVRGVSGRTVNVRRILRQEGREVGSVDRAIAFEELSPREKAFRLGTEVGPELDLMRGFVALELNDPARAAGFFQRADTALSQVLAARLAPPPPTLPAPDPTTPATADAAAPP